jgi:hypothetical protein
VKGLIGGALTPTNTRGSLVYDKLNKDLGLDEKYAGKVVAIEVITKKVVGVGDSVDDAYADSKSKTDSKNLYFKKVGKEYLFRL